MSGTFKLVSEQLPPKHVALIGVSTGPKLHSVTFDGYRFISAENGSEFALGCIVGWYDMSQHKKCDWPLVAGGLRIYINALCSALVNAENSRDGL